MNKKGTVLILFSTIMFGSYGVWSRLIGDSFEPFYQGWTRAVIIAIILVPVLIFRKEFVRVQRKDWRWFTIFLLFTSLTQAPIFYAFNHMDIGTATLLFFVTMLLTMFLVGLFFLGEKLTSIKAISFLIACAGLYFVFSFSVAQFTLFAALMAILNGIASGGEVAFSKKLSNTYSPLYLTGLSWFIIIPTNLALSLILKETQHIPSLNLAWLWQGGYVVVSLFAFWFIIASLKHLEAGIGGLLGLLEIIFSISFGILIFDETLTSKIIFGGLLIIIAAALPHIYSLRTPQRTGTT